MRARQRIEAQGKIVAPGHVTQHSHYDVALFWDPYCSNSGENGVTTVTNANCGFGVAPVRSGDIERTMQMLETTEQIPVSHQRAAMPWDWESFPEYLNRVRKLPKGVNVLTYLPLNPLLVYVMGVAAAKSRRPTTAEMSQMHQLINDAMDAGAIGISMSAMGPEGNSHVDCDGTPMPTDIIASDVILDIARAVVERGEGVIQLLSHIITYGDRSISARLAQMARGSGARVMHNSFVTTDARCTVNEDLAWLNSLRDHGCDVTVSCMLNRGWLESNLRQLDVACGQLTAVREISACKSDDEVLGLLARPEFQRNFVQEHAARGPLHGAGIDGQTVICVGDDPQLAPYMNRTLADIGKAEGRSAVEVMLDLGVRSKLALQLKSGQITAVDPDQAVRLMRHCAVVPGGSDGGAHTKSFGMGHYPTDLLIWMVRDTKLMTLEEMHFQLSLKGARSVQILDRGALLPGYWADVLIYDLNELYFDRSRYEVVHDMPNGTGVQRAGRAAMTVSWSTVLSHTEATDRPARPLGNSSG